MEHPYDPDPIEPSLAAFLELARSGGEAPSPNAEMLATAEALESRPLAAFVHAVATRLGVPDFGRFELEGEALEENGYFDDMMSDIGEGVEAGILIGNTGGGEEGLLMLPDDGDAGYVVYFYAYDGSPYENGSAALRIGTLGDLFAKLAEDGELDDRIRGLLDRQG